MKWLKDWSKWWVDRVVCACVLDLILLGVFGAYNVWEYGRFPF